MIIYTPQGSSDPAEIAESIVDICKAEGFCKTCLTSFMGYEDVEEANGIFTESGIPTYYTPEQAVATYMYMYQYKRNLELHISHINQKNYVSSMLSIVRPYVSVSMPLKIYENNSK